MDDAAWEIKYGWRKWPQYRSHPPESASCSNDKPPVDYRALGIEGNRVKRAARFQQRTATERKAYRSGYLAGHKARQRWEAVLERVVQSLLHGGGRETP